MKIKNFIKSTWEVPQNAIGAFIQKICKAELYTTYEDANVYCWNCHNGLSLGKHIFVPSSFNETPPDNLSSARWNFIMHEYGHTLQSKRLGWFYLPAIVLPSMIWLAFFGGYRRKTGTSYYDFYTEKWANKLGGVDR